MFAFVLTIRASKSIRTSSDVCSSANKPSRNKYVPHCNSAFEKTSKAKKNYISGGNEPGKFENLLQLLRILVCPVLQMLINFLNRSGQHSFPLIAVPSKYLSVLIASALATSFQVKRFILQRLSAITKRFELQKFRSLKKPTK